MSVTSLPRRGRLAVATIMTAALVAALTVLQGSVAIADPVVLQPGELVVNGGAETGTVAGWTGSLANRPHGTGGYPGSVIVNSSGATGGTFAGGTRMFGGMDESSVATQTIDLSPSAAAIDNGNVTALASAFVGGFFNQADNASVTYTFRNGAAATVATFTFGPVYRADRGDVSGFIAFTQNQLLPTGTRDVVISISAERTVAPVNDGYVDNVSLILDAPSPVAVVDTGNTNQGVAVTVTPPTNDSPGAGATIVPDSVRLLDGGLEVTSLTNADGTYVVNTTTGAVTFTPVPTFFGTAAAVPYRITDSSGQRAESTIVITVDYVAAPALTLTKSASPSDPASYVFGTVITYSFVVTNTGNATIYGLVISEDLFSGTGTMTTPVCPVTSLAPGAATTCTATYALTQPDIDALGVGNTASASGAVDGTGAPVVSPQSTVVIPVTPAPAISLVKSADRAGATSLGDVVSYSFLVTNTGNVGVSAVSINEDTFTGTGITPVATCPASSLLPGQSLTCTATYALTQSDVDTGVVTNTAAASATPASGGSVDSTQSSAAITIPARPAFTFAKTADRTTISEAGQTVNYRFRMTNTGNVTLAAPVITETAFNGTGALGTVTCAASAVAPGAALDCTAAYTTIATDLEQTTLANSATADLDDPSGATITSAVSSVVLPVELPDPVTTPTDGPGLAATGSDPTSPLMLAGLLLLAGAGLLSVGWAIRRRRRGNHAS